MIFKIILFDFFFALINSSLIFSQFCLRTNCITADVQVVLQVSFKKKLEIYVGKPVVSLSMRLTLADHQALKYIGWTKYEEPISPFDDNEDKYRLEVRCLVVLR